MHNKNKGVYFRVRSDKLTDDNSFEQINVAKDGQFEDSG